MSVDLSLYLVTDPALCGVRGVVETVRQAVAGGVSIVQLRDKLATDEQTVEQLLELSDAIAGRALLVVDDRLDAAVTAIERGARVDGVHLGQGDAPAEQARALLGPDAIIGLTANTAEHIDAVRALSAGTIDYLGIGVIRPTSTKPDHPPALGVTGFRALAASSPVPCVAIGGIGIDDTEDLRDAGAAGIAVVSALCAADDPTEAARAFRRRWLGERHVPRVLSIAGSDPSGGAGIQADLKSISANGGYGMAAITALTAQSTTGVRAVHVPPASFLTEQLDAIADDIGIDAVKIGMLADGEVIAAVREWVERARPPIVVLDPVMIATSGDRLLAPAAQRALDELIATASLVTPNLDELAALTDRARIDDWPTALEAARTLAARTGTTVLVKGGHLDGDESPDALVTAETVEEFGGSRIRTPAGHGTGCSLSAALATRRAAGADWPQAVREARAWLRESLRAADRLEVGRGSGPVHHFAGLWDRGGLTTRQAPIQVREAWWAGIAELRADIDRLPFIRALAGGTLERSAFLDYLAQDAIYLAEYSRVLADASRLAPSPQEQAFWADGALSAIAGERQVHEAWLRQEPDAAAAPGPVTTGYLDHLRATAFAGDYGTLIAAALPCYWLYADLGVRLAAGEFGAWARDPEHPYADWLSTYGDQAFADAAATATEIVTRRAAEADEQMAARMAAAFETSARHELAFFAAPMR